MGIHTFPQNRALFPSRRRAFFPSSHSQAKLTQYQTKFLGFAHTGREREEIRSARNSRGCSLSLFGTIFLAKRLRHTFFFSLYTSFSARVCILSSRGSYIYAALSRVAGADYVRAKQIVRFIADADSPSRLTSLYICTLYILCEQYVEHVCIICGDAAALVIVYVCKTFDGIECKYRGKSRHK